MRPELEGSDASVDDGRMPLANSTRDHSLQGPRFVSWPPRAFRSAALAVVSMTFAAAGLSYASSSVNGSASRSLQGVQEAPVTPATEEPKLEADGAPSQEDLIAAWKRLSPSDRTDTTQWFIAECDRAQNFRAGLERYVMEQIDGPPHDWPAAEQTPRFDPKTHAPAQIIPRKFVDPTSKAHSKTFKRVAGGTLKRNLTPAVVYDWAKGEIVTVARWDDPERVAMTAAAGFSPYTDLVEAWVTKSLDDRSMAGHARAFGHAYSDRNGRAFEAITLYHAWSSGAELEMPDVECLGIIHSLDDDWKTYVAPVPPRQHQKLYSKIAKHFSAYRKFRGLRDAAARAYLQSNPKLPRGYARTKDRLHGFWESAGSDPAKLATELPDAKDWEDWLNKKGAAVDRDGELVGRRRGRIQALQASEAWTRRTFYGILKEYGAFDPVEAPKVPPPAQGDGAGKGGK